MKLRYVLGVDGGQTSTLAVVADESGALLAAGHGGPANHLDEPGGPERLRRALASAIGEALAEAGLRGETLAAACFGMTGTGALVPDFVPGIVAVEKLLVEHDSTTALAGATAGRPGVIVIAGTGSVALGMNERGEGARVGGWGHLMGDEGSGWDVALRALRAATQAADGRGPTTVLETAIPSHFGVGGLWDLHRKLYSGELGRPRTAEIARVVGDAANAGDGVARAILAAAAADLALAATTVLERLGCLDAALPVAPIGGLFRAGPPVLEPFAAAIARKAPRAVVQTPELPPVVGAVLHALRAIGRPVDAGVLARLRSTLPLVGQAK